MKLLFKIKSKDLHLGFKKDNLTYKKHRTILLTLKKK